MSEVFRQAVLENAPAILLAHNRPSNDLTPIADDIAVTRVIAQAGMPLEIDIVDHIVISMAILFRSKNMVWASVMFLRPIY